MKVFISWSGERSKALAHALRDWIPLVLHYAEPWVSDADVEAGERWAQAVAQELEESHFGIICVTRENVTEPWVLFEAGALAKSFEFGRVIPLLLDLEFSEITGPLAQFQAKKTVRSGLKEVVVGINQVAPDPLPDARLAQLFTALWSELDERISAIPASVEGLRPVRPQQEILEELVSGVRVLDSRMRTLEETSSERRFVPGDAPGRPHPFYLMEVANQIGDEWAALAIVSGLLRGSIPWFHEIVMDAYRASLVGPEEAATAFERVFEAWRGLSRNMDPDGLGLDPRAIDVVSETMRRVELAAHPNRAVRRSQARRARRARTAEERSAAAGSDDSAPND